MSLPVAPNGSLPMGMQGLINPALNPGLAQQNAQQYGLNAAIAGQQGGSSGGPMDLSFLTGGAPVAPRPPMGPDVNYPTELNQQQAPPSALEQLLQQQQAQLNGIGNYTNYMMPYSQIQSMAQNLTNAQYDPQINNLLGQIAQQKQQSGINQNYASQMYNALGDSYIGDIPKLQQQMASEQQATKDQYANTQQQLQGAQNAQAQQQQSALDKLGLQAAQGGGSSGNPNVAAQNAPGVQGVGQQQASDAKYQQGQAALQQQQAQNLLQEQGNSAEQYQHSMADSSRMQGANDVQLLRNSLANYLTGANTQEQSLVGAKAQALAGMEGQLNWQNIQNAQTQYQNAFNRIMASNNFGLDVLKEQDVNQNDMSKLLAELQMNQNQYGSGTVNRPGTTGNMGGPNGAATQLANQFANLGVGQQQATQDSTTILNDINAVMQQVQQNNQASIAKGMRPMPSDMTTYGGMLQTQLQNDGITNPQELAAAYQALLAYNQQLK